MKWILAVVALAGLVVVAAQLQHLVWSTARVENASAHALMDVRVHVNDAIVQVGTLRPGQARLVRLPNRGDATFSVEFAALDRIQFHCKEYVEGDMYHVRVTVSPTLGVSCQTEVGLLTSHLMVLEYW